MKIDKIRKDILDYYESKYGYLKDYFIQNYQINILANKKSFKKLGLNYIKYLLPHDEYVYNIDIQKKGKELLVFKIDFYKLDDLDFRHIKLNKIKEKI